MEGGADVDKRRDMEREERVEVPLGSGNHLQRALIHALNISPLSKVERQGRCDVSP